jgi:hypothetical protein
MNDQTQSEILENHPIGKGLDAFRTSFNSICKDRSISYTLDALAKKVRQSDVCLSTSCLINIQISKISLSISSSLYEISLLFVSYSQRVVAPFAAIS